MRKIDAVLGALMLVLLLVHAVAGGFQAMGVYPGGGAVLSALAWLLLVLVALHLAIGIRLTVDTLRAIRRSGVSYGRLNVLFWVRRISGLALACFLILHLLVFLGEGKGTAYRLAFFGSLQFAGQIGMVASLAVHVLSNLRPLFLSLGVSRARAVLADLLLVLAVVLLFAGAAMLVYYLRWNVWWRC